MFHSARAAALLLALALAAGCRPSGRDADHTGSPAGGVTGVDPGFLYGRVTTVDGDTHEGRLRFGGEQEAFWGDYFNGFREENPWLEHLPEEPWIEVLGLGIGTRERRVERRPFMARFGDIARIEARGSDLWVTLKSGTIFHLDRYAADDFADGLTVWEAGGGTLEFDEDRVRSIDFLPVEGMRAAAPHRLHGTVRTLRGEFTGFLEWNRRGSIGSDELEGRAGDGERLRLPFDTIRSIARETRASARVTLLDGTELVLSDTRDVGEGHGGVYVDDPRYGRVLIPWLTLERVDFGAAAAAGSGPAWEDFPVGGPLTGSVTTRDGRRLEGRLVFDLDESEITETLDAPAAGVDYTIPFGLVASILLPPGGTAWVTLRHGEELQLERAGDLGDGNAGVLIFVDGRDDPDYLPWSDVEQIRLDQPPAMYPAVNAR